MKYLYLAQLNHKFRKKMLKYDTFYLLYTSWEWQFKFNTAVRGFPQLVALILSLSLSLSGAKIEEGRLNAQKMHGVGPTPKCIHVYNIDSATK